MTHHFSCTRCGRCCHDLKVPLTTGEAVAWLGRGHPVQVLCEAIPWLQVPTDDDERAAHRRRRSFAARSGALPMRVVVILAADIVGACPNLRADLRCGIYEHRPLVCRIYPAEINPFIRLEPVHKACPPEAWTADLPLFEQSGTVVDPGTRAAILESRATDASETLVKSRLCAALLISDTGLAEEGFVVHSPSNADLQNALAMAAAAAGLPSEQWRFVSNQATTVEELAAQGASVIHSSAERAAPYRYLGFKPES